MKIIYEDDYGNRTFNNSVVAIPGDIVMISGEDWVVKSRFIDLDNDQVIISITQNSTKSAPTLVNDTGRLAEMQRAILEVNKRQDTSEKKSRMLSEQVVTIRKHINQKIQQERKET